MHFINYKFTLWELKRKISLPIELKIFKAQVKTIELVKIQLVIKILQFSATNSNYSFLLFKVKKYFHSAFYLNLITVLDMLCLMYSLRHVR